MVKQEVKIWNWWHAPTLLQSCKTGCVWKPCFVKFDHIYHIYLVICCGYLSLKNQCGNYSNSTTINDAGKWFLSPYFHNQLWAPSSVATIQGVASNQVNAVAKFFLSVLKGGLGYLAWRLHLHICRSYLWQT